MAIIKRTTKTGTVRWAVKYLEAGRQREKWFNTRGEAVAFDAAVKLQKRNHLPVFSDRTTVRELATEWWNSHASRLQKRTQDGYRVHLTNRICPPIGTGAGLGEYRLSDLDTPTLSQWLIDLRRNGAGVPTVNATLKVLNAMFTKGVEWQIMARNPAAGIKRLPEPSRQLEILSMQDVFRLANKAGETRHRDFALIITAAFTGLRISELFALQWTDVRDNTLRVDRALDEDCTFKEPKNYERRTVPLFDVAARALTEWHAAAPTGCALVFPTTTGSPIHESNFNRRSWQPARNAANLPGVRFHDLRHTFASLCIEDGVQIVRLSKWMGHRKPSVTMDVYGHLYDALDDSAYVQMNDRLNTRLTHL